MFTHRPAEITGSIDDFYYYHSLDLKNGESVDGDWDLRNRFSDYTGGIDLTSKSVVDVGTASGFLAFEAEKVAARCVAIDLPPNGEWDVVPYAENDIDPAKSDDITYLDQCLQTTRAEAARKRKRSGIDSMRNGFWYAHKQNNSNVKLYESAVYDVKSDLGFHDVALFGSILLHLRDPFAALHNISQQIRSEIVIADLYHKAPNLTANEKVVGFLPEAKRRQHKNAWWRLYRPVIEEMLQVCGFEPHTFKVDDYKFKGRDMAVFTVVARRVRF